MNYFKDILAQKELYLLSIGFCIIAFYIIIREISESAKIKRSINKKLNSLKEMTSQTSQFKLQPISFFGIIDELAYINIKNSFSIYQQFLGVYLFLLRAVAIQESNREYLRSDECAKNVKAAFQPFSETFVKSRFPSSYLSNFTKSIIPVNETNDYSKTDELIGNLRQIVRESNKSSIAPVLNIVAAQSLLKPWGVPEKLNKIHPNVLVPFIHIRGRILGVSAISEAITSRRKIISFRRGLFELISQLIKCYETQDFSSLTERLAKFDNKFRMSPI